MKLVSLNNIVKKFLVEEGHEDLVQKWTSSSIQRKLKSTVTRLSGQSKDPHAPKRSQSAYLFFCADNRDKVKKSLGPDGKATDITRKLGKMWNDLKKKNSSAVKKYEKMAQEDKARYTREMQSYTPSTLQTPSVTEEDFDIPQKKVKDPHAPKRSQSAYLFFCADNRSSVKEQLGSDCKITDVTRELGRLWNELKQSGDEDYERYIDLARQDAERYQCEIKSYKA